MWLFYWSLYVKLALVTCSSSSSSPKETNTAPTSNNNNNHLSSQLHPAQALGLHQIFKHRSIDKRCKCHCKADIKYSIPPEIYILTNLDSNNKDNKDQENVNEILDKGSDCSCETTVQPIFEREHPNFDYKDPNKVQEYCKLCHCIFETRDTNMIKFSINVYVIIILSVVFYGVLVKFELVDVILKKILNEKYHSKIPKQKLGRRIEDYEKSQTKKHEKRVLQHRYLVQKLANSSNNPKLTVTSTCGSNLNRSCFDLNANSLG